MFHGAHASDEQLHELAKYGFVIRAAAEFRCGVDRHGVRDLEQDRRPHASNGAVGVAAGDATGVTEGNRTREERRKGEHELPRDRGDRAVRLPREDAAALAKHGIGVRPAPDELREGDGLVEGWALLAAHGLGVALDLREDGVAQPEALVAQFGNELGLVLAAWGVNRTHRFEQAERQEWVDGGGHWGRQRGDGRATKLSRGGAGVQFERELSERWELHLSLNSDSNSTSRVSFVRPSARSSSIEQALVIRALAGGVVAGAITAVARRTHTLSESGQWAAFFTGIAVAAAGWWWALTLIVFFVTSSALSHWRAPEKMRITEGTLPRATARNASQVLANGGVFVLLAFGSTYTGRERLAFAALGALAAASSDTWSTEIGTLFGGTPRLITTGQPVEPGLSGGVTLAGLGAAIGGALLVAGVGAFSIAQHHRPLAMAAAAGGFGGGLVDSVVGATLQSRRFCDRCRHWTERRVHACGFRTRHARGIPWMTNDAVNVCGTLAGATIAFFAGSVLAR
jgi:uncharacterized protein (TIGR00297 family)